MEVKSKRSARARPARGGLKEAHSYSREPMNKNRIRGGPGRASWLETAKPISIKAQIGRRTGGCATKVVGELPREICTAVREDWGAPRGGPSAVQKSAEGVVLAMKLAAGRDKDSYGAGRFARGRPERSPKEMGSNGEASRRRNS